MGVIDARGVLSFNGRHGNVALTSTDLPIATAGQVGAVKVGAEAVSNILLGADGSLSVPIAGATQAGVVTVAAQVTSNLVLNAGALSVPLATATVPGVITVPANGGLTLSAGALSANVLSVNGQTGAVALSVANITGAAPLASPTFTGVPTAPTPAAGTNTTQVATTAFVGTAIQNATGVFTPRTSNTSPVTALATDSYIGVNVAGAAVVNLPSGATLTNGKSIIVKDESGAASTHNISIVANGSDKIDGQASATISINYGSITILWNTDHWSII